jgi:hypothetical protein
MDFAYGETVTRIRAGSKTDPYSGEPVDLDWSAANELNIAGAGFDPGGSQSTLDARRDMVTTSPTLYLPAGSDVLEGDRMRVRGVVYAVDGRPADWRSPFTGWRPGLVVTLKSVEG